MQSLKNGRWLNQPANSEASDLGLSVTTDASTDFWRETHYGFVRDNGHFYAFQADGDFTAQVRVQAHFEHLYDQAGLMVRLDERRWVKTGIEFSDGYGLLGSVLTNEASDWATGRYDGDPSDFWIRSAFHRDCRFRQAVCRRRRASTRAPGDPVQETEQPPRSSWRSRRSQHLKTDAVQKRSRTTICRTESHPNRRSRHQSCGVPIPRGLGKSMI